MRLWDSDALRNLGKILGLRTKLPERIDFQDDLVQVTLDPLWEIRRALALPRAGGGFFTARIENGPHAVGVDTIISTVDPYDLNNSGNTAVTYTDPEYPVPVPEELDVWLIACTASVKAGAGNFSSGSLHYLIDANSMGWRTDDTSAIATGDFLRLYANEVAGPVFTLLVGPDLTPDFLFQRPYRLPRARVFDSSTVRGLRFTTENTGGTPTYRLDMLFGLFPAGMGQDMVP